MNTFLSDNGSVEECGGEYCLFSFHRERMGGEVGDGEVRRGRHVLQQSRG